ncbi:MAG: radical SAM protein [Candidatus Omnitrophica bacterium]|nr:radical SAM protein [Candidatus Omnitrophota bacterium]
MKKNKQILKNPGKYRKYLTLQGIKNDKIYCGPQLVHIYINTNCNLRCEYCWFHSHLAPKNNVPYKILQWKKFTEILKDCKEMGVEHIVLSSIGEPSLHPDIGKMIRKIKKNGMDLRITTNLTFTKKSLLKVFGLADELAINSSAIDNNSYQQMYKPRDKSNFDLIINNINFFTNVRKKINKPRIEIRYIITDNNFHYIEKALDIYKKLKVNDVYFTFMDTTLENKNISLKKKNKKELVKLLKKNLKKDFPFQHNLKEIYSSLIDYNNCEFNLSQCLLIWERLSIEINGNISLCCHNEKLTVGNIYQDNIKDIWWSKKTHAIRLKGKYSFNLNDNMWKACKYCFATKQNKFYINQSKLI